MGAEPWSYFVPFEPSVEAALEKLRQRVFASGEFFRSELQPADINEAMENAEETGTRSILDIQSVGDSAEICTVCPLSDDDLRRHIGTTRPTHAQVEKAFGVFEDIDRGQGIYLTVYDADEPSEYFFAGYTFD